MGSDVLKELEKAAAEANGAGAEAADQHSEA